MAIVLISDFGTGDSYAGVLKGVITSIAPDASVMDLAHDLPPFNIAHAALTLYQSYSYFPSDTIFLVVVDPGVGTSRKPILVKTERYAFIGPDNGVFSLALENETVYQIIHLENPKYFLKSVSSTFHGRDIFAPVAAHLHQKVDLLEFGSKLETYKKIPGLEPEITPNRIVGRILSIDRFGNAITNLKRDFLEKHFPKLNFFLEVGTIHELFLRGIHDYYAEGQSNQPFLLFGSTGFLEIGVNQGSAANLLGIQSGDEVKVPKKK